MTVLLLGGAPLAAQSLADYAAGQSALAGDSQYQRQHSDLDKFNQAAAQNPGTEASPNTPANAQDSAAMLTVTRLPDMKLNENIIKDTVFTYPASKQEQAASALLAAGSTQEALNAYEDLIATAADNATSAAAAGDIALLALQGGDYKKALHYIEQAQNLDGKNPFYTLVKIWILAANGDNKAANKEYDKMLFLTADFEYLSSAKLAMAQADFIAGKNKPAIDALQNLYASNPYMISHAIYLMGAIAHKQGQDNIAQTLLGQALAHDSNNYMAQQYNASAQEKLGQSVNAWQAYASLFLLDPKNTALAKRMKKLSKHLKAPKRDYLFYTRVEDIFSPASAKPAPGPNMRVGLYAQKDGALAPVQGFIFHPGADFSIKDEKLGKVISGPAGTPRAVVFDATTQSAQIQNKFNAADFSTKNPFVIDLDKPGASLLIRNAQSADVFAADIGDKELRGAVLVIPGADGMRLINYTKAEDILPAVLTHAARGARESAALEALAIVLRTALEAQIKPGAAAAYDMPDSDPLYTYGGLNMAGAAATAAAKATLGKTLPVEPYFYHSCGPVAEGAVQNTGEKITYAFTPGNLFKYMFSNPPKDLTSAPQDATLWAGVKWVYSFPLKDIQARLAQKHAAIGALKAVQPAQFTPTGRVLSVRFIGKKGSVEVPFEEANFILAAGTLRSNFFYSAPFGKGAKAKEYIFIGADSGLGRGLCVEGARGMARAGKTTTQILKYYYPQAANPQWQQLK